MSDDAVLLEFTNKDIDDILKFLCRERETVSSAISRIIKSEIKNKKLRNDLGRK